MTLTCKEMLNEWRKGLNEETENNLKEFIKSI